jgi:hypothetical protein
MDGENVSAATASPKDAKQPRQRSTIAFPYTDLSACIEMADAIHTHVGLGDCDDDQLAAWTDQSPKSSGFRTQVYAARTFGLLSGDSGRHRLTDLGRMAVDPNQVREARAQAFLAVPLFKSLYEAYKGGVIPPASALEREIAGLGVSDKQKERARQVFEKSADQAGFFEHGRNRLVRPGVPARDPKLDKPPLDGSGSGGGNGGGNGKEPPDVDPIINGLLARLPKTGQVWPKAQRKLWLQLLEGSFELIYKEDEAAQ